MSNTMDQTATDNNSTSAKPLVADDLKQIKDSFSTLRKDVMELLHTTLGLGKHGAEFASEEAGAVASNLKDRLGNLKNQGEETLHAVEKKIGDNPLPATLIAFGVGFLVAKILSRR